MFFGADNLPYFMKHKDWSSFPDPACLSQPTVIATENVIKYIEKINSEHTHIDENGVRWTDF